MKALSVGMCLCRKLLVFHALAWVRQLSLLQFVLMEGKQFYITFKKKFDPKLYRALVTIVTVNSRFIYVTVSAGGKSIDMQRMLFRKGNVWVVHRMIVDNFGRTTQVHLNMMEEIKKAIDEQLKKLKLLP